MSYQTMQRQAGTRLIVSCKYENSDGVISSHYSGLTEFFKFYPKVNESPFKGNMEWYQIKGQDRVFVNQ